MRQTSIFFGPPGTGKTTALLDEVENELKRGTDPSRIAFFAFTRKAANEAITRACDRFGIKDDDLPWFRTLHSAAFKMLGLSSTEVMQDGHYAELAAALGDGIRFDFSYDHETERVPQGGALGDMLLSAYSRARSRGIVIDEEYANMAFDDSGVEYLRDRLLPFVKALDEYKDAFHLLDFSDFLDEVHTPLDVELLILDESQDLTYQQWAFARRIAAQAKRVIIAGDDDQAIFQWAGSDLNTFLALRGNPYRVLPVSHRLPFAIWGKCQEIVTGIGYRRPKQWESRKEAGAVRYLDIADDADINNGQSWLLLARLRYQAEAFTALCRDRGVVYQLDHVWSNQTPEVRAVVDYERLRRGEVIPGDRLHRLAQFIPNMPQVSHSGEITWNDIQWPFEGMPDWMHALRGLGDEQREYIRRLRRNNESLVGPGRVTLSTIHGVKGGEADNVLLRPDISRRVAAGMESDPDAERRVWYVGASRARQTLSIMAPTSSRFVEI